MEEGRRDSSCNSKPSHVRKLNFGQSILALNVVNQFGEQKHGRLLIDHNVAKIPCTERGEFVRKWIETHGDRGFDSNDESPRSSQSSPILGSSTTKRVERSPILGNRRKRARGKASLNNSSIKSAREEITKENSPVPSKIPNVGASPILDRNSYSYKRRRRKLREKNLQRKVLHSIGNNYVDTNMNSVVLRDLANIQGSSNKHGIMSSQKQQLLLRKLETSYDETDLESHVKEDCKILEDSIASRSPVSELKLNIDDSPIAKDNVKIDTESSIEDNNCTELQETLSNQIEDEDTQDAAPPIKRCCSIHSSTLTASKPASIYSQTSNKDSDKTFFSKAEQGPQNLSMSPSQRISQISSQINNITDNKSSEADIIISTETSSQRIYTDPTMHLDILDSGKKRKKPKKGSLSEKLQSLIGRQISSVRIWRHQIKQTAKDNTSVQCVTVCVQKCTSRFSRQFLEGIVIEDPFNLLPQKSSYSPVTIMTIPEIVGRIQMRSESIVKIFPPWEILDDKKLTLNVTYISVVSDKKKIDVERSRRNEETKRTVKEFDCPCISADAMLPFCKERSGKPNVMEHLFTE